MKAISIHQPWASLIRDGKKPIETRCWQTHYRGDVLICATKKEFYINGQLIGPNGVAVAIVSISDCRPMVKSDEKAACCDWYEGAWAWCLEDLRVIEPFPVKGAQRLFNVEPLEKIITLKVGGFDVDSGIDPANAGGDVTAYFHRPDFQ